MSDHEQRIKQLEMYNQFLLRHVERIEDRLYQNEELLKELAGVIVLERTGDREIH